MSTELKVRKRQDKAKETSKLHPQETAQDELKGKSVPYKYGPLPKFSGQRIFSRIIIIIGVLIYVWYFSKGGKETILAKFDYTYDGRGHHVECDKSYMDEIKQYTGCIPRKCGRFISDRIITEYEADILLWLAKRGMSLGGSNGGATIMDLHSGALSYGENFINFYKSMKTNFITPTDLKIYRSVREKIQRAIAESFGLDTTKLFLTHPTFFSRLTGKAAVSIHDEYWHVHVDKHTYESFHYTSLLYLNDYSKDFQGGRFIYLDSPQANVTVEPRKGRVSMFTSGAENPHFVEKVTEGERFAITISFTCDQNKRISDPSFIQKDL
ncbi:2-oxoglutarate and iron-dependent oxygenase domain-containing protein 3-like [Euwallacea similis]|uniref:2-oxoglutarate and iron-dependent oxygenase domain-containing protein 3-like n=1 Tax=Euwallacea similis TaxID=1736056 RepID=UPI00344E18CC